jgi:hypothetical protein
VEYGDIKEFNHVGIRKLSAPAIADLAVRAARGVFHPETNRILKFYGVNKKDWVPPLEKYFEWSELPTEIGGQKEYEEIESDLR